MDKQVDINELLDVSKIPGFDSGDVIPAYEPLELRDVKSNPENRYVDLETDYTTVRQNLYYQQQMLLDAAKIFLETAKNSESPRHMEVFSALMGQMTVSNREMIKVHKDMRDITDEKTANDQNQTQQHQYFSSPADRMKRFGSSFDAIDASSAEVIEVVSEKEE